MAKLRIIVDNTNMEKYDSGMLCCPACDGDNFANEDDEEDIGNGESRLEVSCFDCGCQWYEVYKANRCIEIYGRDGDN